MDIFRVTALPPPDAKTRELLSVIAEKPDLIRGGGPSFITKRLKELRRTGFLRCRGRRDARFAPRPKSSAVGDTAQRGRPMPAASLKSRSLSRDSRRNAVQGWIYSRCSWYRRLWRRVRYCVSWIVGRFEGLIGLVIASGTGALGFLPRSVRCWRHHGFEAPNVTLDEVQALYHKA